MGLFKHQGRIISTGQIPTEKPSRKCIELIIDDIWLIGLQLRNFLGFPAPSSAYIFLNWEYDMSDPETKYEILNTEKVEQSVSRY